MSLDGKQQTSESVKEAETPAPAPARVLLLGMGRPPIFLAAAMAVAEFEPCDYAISADTEDEVEATYAYAELSERLVIHRCQPASFEGTCSC
jgi:hypothetical protein